MSAFKEGSESSTVGKTVHDRFHITREVDEDASLVDVNLVVIGDPGTGKSSFISQYYSKSASVETLSGKGTVSSTTVDVTSDQIHAKLRLNTFDTQAATVRTPEQCKALYSTANGVFILFDVTNRQSFDNMTSHLMQMAEYGNDDTMVFFIANKVDSPRENWAVTTQEAETYSETYGGFFHEVSALSGQNLSDAMNAMIIAVSTIVAQSKSDQHQPYASEEEDKAAEAAAAATSNSKDSAAEGVPPPSLYAWIEKKSKYLHFWNRRYFRLVEGLLSFAQSETEEEAIHGLFLNKDLQVVAIGDLQLDVNSSKKSMSLRFAKVEARDAWKAAILHHAHFGEVYLRQQVGYMKELGGESQSKILHMMKR
jgi:small GTP-binding protein